MRIKTEYTHMEIRFSDEINEILTLAREEAMRTGSYGIDIDHIFLGILRHRKNDACEMLQELDVDLDDAKVFIDKQILHSESIPYTSVEKIRLTKSSQRLISLAVLEATKLGESQTRPLHLLLAISRDSSSYAHEFLELKCVDSVVLLAHIMESRAAGSDDAEDSDGGLTIEDYGVDLCALAAAGALDPVDGRENEIERVIEVLCRRKKNNALLVGEAGVGKSAIVESLALKIAGGEIPALKGKRLMSLDIASVVAGTRYRGDFEKRLKEIIAELRSHTEIILFIDEFHTIVGAGGGQGSLDAANILKPALARGEIQCIGATTLSEFSKVVRKDAALNRRFQTVMVEPMTVEQSIYVLNVLEKKYAEYHGVRYDRDALLACARLTDRYISDRALPDKAIDAMDEAGAMVKIHSKKKAWPAVTREDVAKVVSRMSGVPVSKVAKDEGQKLLGMRESLQRYVVGQEEAIDCVVRAIQRSRAGLKSPGRPIGSFLFLGSTGVGKTRLAKCIAEQLFDSEDNLVRIDMSEYSEKFTTSRLIGAPPGYVGYEEGGQLSEKVLQKPYCVVLLDEIEKAHPDIYNLLLQVLDEGRLTDGNGRTVDFRNTVIIMTSNAGTRELEEFGRGVGFAASSKNVELDRQAVLEKAVRKVFPPEFLNRVDEKVFFKPLGVEELEKIVDIELEELRQRALETGYKFSVAKALKHAVEVDSYDPSYGARPLKRAIMNRIENPVSEFIISQRINGAPDKVLTLSVGLASDGKSTKVKVR